MGYFRSYFLSSIIQTHENKKHCKLYDHFYLVIIRGSFQGESRLRKPRALSEARTRRNNHASFSFHQGFVRSGTIVALFLSKKIVNSLSYNVRFISRRVYILCILESWLDEWIVRNDEKNFVEISCLLFSTHVRNNAASFVSSYSLIGRIILLFLWTRSNNNFVDKNFVIIGDIPISLKDDLKKIWRRI